MEAELVRDVSHKGTPGEVAVAVAVADMEGQVIRSGRRREYQAV